MHAREVTPGVDRPDVNELSLEPSETTYRNLDGNRLMTRSVPFLDYVVDGTPLRVMLRDAGYDNDSVTGLCRSWPGSAEQTAAALLRGGSDREAGIDILVCAVCGDRDCGALVADVFLGTETVTWAAWRFADSSGMEPIQALPRFTFDRIRYEELLRTAPAAAAALPYDEQANRPRRFLWPWQWGWRLPRAP